MVEQVREAYPSQNKLHKKGEFSMSETTVKAEKTFDLPENFLKRVEAWESSTGAEEAAKKAGVVFPEGHAKEGSPNAGAMSAWASTTRTVRGINLKKMARGRQGSGGVDASVANEFIANLRERLGNGIRNTPLEEAVARK